MDGIERRHVPLYHDMVPVVYGYVSAAVRRRGQDRRMRVHEHLFEEALYLPFDLLDPQALLGAGLAVSDTKVEGQPIQEHPAALREAARVAIGKARGRLEARLGRRWLKEFEEGEGWLVVDGSLGGTLGGDYQRYASPRIIGLVKSHQTQYFPLEEQRRVLSLRAGERSSVFQPLGQQGAVGEAGEIVAPREVLDFDGAAEAQRGAGCLLRAGARRGRGCRSNPGTGR